MSDLNALNKETHEAWEENADVWDNRMGDEGNELFNILCWPALASLLDLRPGYCLWQRPHHPPPCRTRRASDSIRLLLQPDR